MICRTDHIVRCAAERLGWWKNDSRHYLYRMGIVCVLVHYERGGKREMKWAFDWLREKFKEDIEWYETHGISKDFNRGIIGESNKGISLVDEAEAKWESEVCEWKQEKYLNFALSTCNTSCGNRNSIIDAFKYCPYCGKPIKIVEVE